MDDLGGGGAHNTQLKIANVNDLTGFGRCSLAAAWPIISRLGVQCCPVPTAILSNHTGFDSYFFDDYTDRLVPYVDEWRKLGLTFDGILTGFLGSERQVEIVERFVGDFSTEATVVTVDPVMGDAGRLYSTYTDDLARSVRRLLPVAHAVTPNLTEACVLADVPYHDRPTADELADIARRICEQGPSCVVITGVDRGDSLDNFCLEYGEVPYTVSAEKVAIQRSGTGDVFSAIIAAGLVRGVPFARCVRTACEFIGSCLRYTAWLGVPETDGVCFEPLLGQLSFFEEG